MKHEGKFFVNNAIYLSEKISNVDNEQPPNK